MGARFFHLTAAGVSLILIQEGKSLPRVLHWGKAVAQAETSQLAELDEGTRIVLGSDTLDMPAYCSILPVASEGWAGIPGVEVHRGGVGFSPLFVVDDVVEEALPLGGRSVRWITHDQLTQAGLEVTIEMTHSGVVRVRGTVRNDAPESSGVPDASEASVDGYRPSRIAHTADLEVVTLEPVLPVPNWATEIIEHGGRHLLERQETRAPFPLGVHLRENRKGRGHDATLLLCACEAGARYRQGETWAIHTGWSGYTRMWAQRVQPAGQRVMGGGELLLPGEVVLKPGDSYSSPWLYGSYGDGLDEMAGRFHDYLRSRPQYSPAPRKVLVNSWEAVYFDHSADRLNNLVDAAQMAGAERFVLDDGWFHARRNSQAGLGDWWVDPDVWPMGLQPFIDRVHERGMDFGIWVEPEMVNPDSDVARAHPHWILQPGDGRLPALSRNQYVLNLANPEAWHHVFRQLDALLTDHDIAYIKWDHNRDVWEAGDALTGKPFVHKHTEAMYRLWDSLRSRHPDVEFESCSAGGGRADLGMMTRADRVWASDTIDAFERSRIDQATQLLLPPEMVGVHIGAPTAHTTGRTHSLAFRGATALFGHLGIEWDLTTIGPHEIAELRRWVDLYRATRELLHTGHVVHADVVDPSHLVHGVVARDRREALFAFVQLGAGLSYPAGRVRIPGLSDGCDYRVRLLPPGDKVGPIKSFPHGWWEGGVTLSGEFLGTVGLACPPQLPESAILVNIIAMERGPRH